MIDRIKKLRARMEQGGIDTVIIFQNKDLYYFSGTTQNCVLAVTGNDAILFVMRNVERAASETFIEHTVKMKSTNEIKNFISAKKIGIEEDVLPVSVYQRLVQMFPSAEFCDISQAVREIRAIKDESEIKLLKRSASINDAGHRKAREVLREGMTELELSAAISNEMRRLGDDLAVRSRHWNSLPPTQIASGKNSCFANRSFIALGGVGLSAANPCGPSVKKIKKGEPIYVDLVPSCGGYASDETRTYWLGSTPKNREVTTAYDVCVEIYDALVDKMEIGVPVRELYKLSLAMAKEHGYENTFLGTGEYRVKFIGHGIGLELDELPVLADNDAKLEENMVLTIEPKIVTSEGGVGIEDTILITKKGAKTLTNSERGIGV